MLLARRIPVMPNHLFGVISGLVPGQLRLAR